MGDGCPPRTALVAYSNGGLSDREAAELQSHMSVCLDCAEQIDAITRVQLEALGVHPVVIAAQARASLEAVRQLIQQAQSGFPKAPRQSHADVLSALEPPVQPGSLGRFAGYDVLEIAGSGGMGVVLKAHDPTLRRTVALKVLEPARAWDQESAARFLREARTIAAIQHDNVVVIHVAGQEKGLPYLVMPFHAEGTLEQRLQQTPRLETADVIRVGLQLAQALEITHAKGVLHRDIKPSNVLIEGGLERVRLADFGLAQPVSEETARASASRARPDGASKRTLAGTPQYMSPEQARGQTTDARSDLFGLGAVLYQMATGRAIYEGASVQEILDAAAGGQSAPACRLTPGIPPALAAIIDRLLATRPEDRFASAAEVAAALGQLRNSAHPHRRWVPRAGVTALAACLLFGAVIALFDWTGRTAFFNTLLCRQTGHGYFIRGRFGTYAELSDAVLASRAGDVIEARFSGERVTGGFRLGGKPLTIRAAHGFQPSLYATNNARAFILADGPLTLEGLTLVRRVRGIGFTPLIEVQEAPLVLLNCRLLRSAPQGGDIVIKAGQLVPVADENRPSPPLLVLAPGGYCSMRNCLVLGSLGTAVALLGGRQEPIRVEIKDSLFAMHRIFALRSEPGFTAELDASGSVFASEMLIDLGNAEANQGVRVNWTDCVLDRSQGVFVRLNQHGNGEWLRRMAWNENHVTYVGSGDFLVDRKGRRVISDEEWKGLMRLTANSHVAAHGKVFAGVRARSNQRVSGADVNTDGLRQAAGGKLRFASEWVGEGEPYDRFRARPEYRQWQQQARDLVRGWAQHRAASSRTQAR